MAWIIKNCLEGPVIINDLGITLARNATRDLDIFGRGVAERSNDIKILLSKECIKTLSKDEIPSDSISQSLKESTEKAAEVIQKALELTKQNQNNNIGNSEVIKKLELELEIQKTQTTAIVEQNKVLTEQNKVMNENTAQLLAAVKKMVEDQPLQTKTLVETLKNIKVERSEIATEREKLDPSKMSDEEFKCQENILKLKDSKLEKNFNDIGSTITKKTDSTIDESIDALEDLGL